MNSVKLITKRLINNGFQVFYVGGYVRDTLSEIKSEDVDLNTNARPKELIKLFKDRNVKLVGESFGVVIIDGIEVATFRKDRYSGFNDKNVEITYADTLKEDAERRDFTINAIAMNVETGEVIDFFGGIYDLHHGIIRFVGDPKKRIFEDPNRIIRACRFLAKLDGTFEYKTFDALKTFTDKAFKHISKERIRLEIMKSMKIEEASIFFEALYRIGMLKYIFPSLTNCYGMKHGKYHQEGVFRHNMLCGDYITTKQPLLKLMGYLHDCGKSEAYQCTDEGEISFIGHEDVGSRITRRELKNLTFSNDEIDYISNMVKFHMRGLKHSGPKAIRRLLKELDNHNLNYKDLLKFKIADRKANLKKNNYSCSDIKGFINKYGTELHREEKESFMKLAISGFHIMELTGLLPGPEVGEIKKKLEELIIDNPEKNNKEYLLNYIKEEFK